MVQTIQARNVTLHDLKTKFGLQLVEDKQFFREWQDNLPEINDLEKQRLDRAKASYSNLLEYPPLLENTVKMVVLSQLLELANFYLPPFHIKSEKSVEISAEDEGVIVKGDIDVLVVSEQLWVAVIECKQASFSLDAGRAQLLAYMLANPHPDKPAFGLLTNGANFRFFKLVKNQFPQYAMSKMFDIFNPGNDLYGVLSVLKRLGQLIISK
ncbi:type I restriction endonuclease [Iningainema tapete]|uniref:Restriction endonuclease subunit R n=1 Tax=Iningainema tapete BLCC-T55 TaxID=2748662 RepID=A0A8J6XPP6_9CYAN|nr:type I restriction endonuclease [Iningainema tapete]MBD2775849.1 restriction endonuclease subunit R [Iningainema tapete BLCC-T55]